MIKWLKNAFFKGLVILIPIVLVWITLRELVELLVDFAVPIADALPPESLEWVRNPALVAPVMILIVAVVLGMLASVPMIRTAGAALERNTLGHLPFYRMIKTFVTAFLEVEDAASFRPAVITGDDGGGEPCYVIEDKQGHDNVVVLVPWSPASFAGSVKLVPRQRIRMLDLTFDEFSLSLANFGLGLHEQLEQSGALDKSKD